jgi:hypothetical protein
MDLDEGTLAVIAYFGCIAAVLAALGAITRWSYRRHIAKFGPPPPGSGMKTFGWFVGWCALLAFLIWAWPEGALVVMGGAFLAPHILRFDDRAWGSWQRFRDAGIYAAVVFVPIAFLAYSAQSS